MDVYFLLFVFITVSVCICNVAALEPALHSEDDVKSPMVWPMPANISVGSTTLPLAAGFLFTAKVAGNSLESVPPTLAEAFEEYLNLIFKTHLPDTTPLATPQPNSILHSLVVDLDSPDETLKFGTDESYTLQVPDPHNPNSAYLKAKTVYGALRGLETFSQFCHFNFTIQTFEVHNTSLSITDYPKFAYRGLLIDTGRHFLPVGEIKKVLDIMSWAKMNVLHWHVADSQSFPLEVPSYERLWDGSYSVMERYTIADAKAIVEYARKRGIHVMAELDVPGHAESWGVGFPMLWPSPQCREPLDVSKKFTFDLIDGVISDLSKVFTFDFMHLGGDEVDTSCWTDTPQVNEWLVKGNLTTADAYKGFVLKAGAIARSHGYTPVNWEETFNEFHEAMDNKTVIHNWLGGGAAPSIVKAGFRCIVSNQDVWYLDHLDTTWEQFYENDPLKDITNEEERKLVLGGEVCMWGETVDASDIHSTIMPRAAAAAERLWTYPAITPEKTTSALSRLHNFRCLLNRRGIAAGPVLERGRESPAGPGSCFSQ